MRLDLRDLRELAAEKLSALPAAVRAPEVTRDELVRDVGEMTWALHTIAAAELLIEGRPRGFYLNLSRAAENWRRLLARLAARGDKLPPASHSAAFLGAVAAADWDRAKEIARLSSSAWQGGPQGEEYEEDFAWSHLLHQYVTGAQPEILADLAQSVRRAGADSYQDRLSLIEALWAGDAARFREAFELVWSSHAEEVETAARSPVASAVELGPYRSLWFEGLAYQRLGERRGFDVSASPLRYLPALASAARTPPNALDNDEHDE